MSMGRWIGTTTLLYVWVSFPVSVLAATLIVADPWGLRRHDTQYHLYDVPWLAAGFTVANLIFTGLLTVAILTLPAWLMRGSRHQVLFKVLALGLTFWVPFLRVLLQASLEEGVSALVTQVVFCCLVSLPRDSAHDQRAVEPSASPSA